MVRVVQIGLTFSRLYRNTHSRLNSLHVNANDFQRHTALLLRSAHSKTPTRDCEGEGRDNETEDEPGTATEETIPIVKWQ